MSSEGQLFSGVQWSILSARVADLSRRVGALDTPHALDPATGRALFRATVTAFEELLALLEPFVDEAEWHPHVSDPHRGPVAG